MPVNGPLNLLQELDRLEREWAGDGIGGGRSSRSRVRVQGEVLPMEPSAATVDVMEVGIREIDREGVGFVAPRVLPTGSTWHLRFLRSGSVVGQQGVVIKQCREVKEGVYLVDGGFCVEPMLLLALGLEPARKRDGGEPMRGQFIRPEEVA